MERENLSSRSPDSSCPYFLYATEGYDILEGVFPAVPSILDNLISSSVEEDLQNHIFDTNNTSNSQIPRDLSRGDYEHNERRSVINFTLGRNSIENIFAPVSVAPVPAVGSFQSRSSATSNSGGLSSTSYENSSTSNDNFLRNIFNADIDTLLPFSPSSTQHSNLPHFTSSSNRLSASNAAAAPFPETEQTHVSSTSILNDSNNSSIPSLDTNLANNTRQQNTNNFTSQISSQPTSSTSHNSLAQMPLPSYNLNAQLPIGSAKHSHEERGVKRKSSPVLTNSHYLSSAPSSSLNYVNREQNISNNWKKSTVSGGSSHSEVEQVDDDIQIILPEINPSSSASSSSTSNNHQHVTIDSSRLNLSSSSQLATAECDPIQNSPPSIPEASEADDLVRLLGVIYRDRENNDDPFNTIPVDSETQSISRVSDGEDSSSSSIVSIHDVEEGGSANQSPRLLKKVPNNVPSVITIDDSPKDEELLEIKIKQEAENVKEDFKKLLEDELICNICTELLIKPITLGCSHTFCKFCISEWKEKKNQCPMCRAEVVTETPCLFLDNFISKAVGQLDPTSVEKRLEIIKTREELLKNKVRKPRLRLSQTLNLRSNPPPIVNLPIYMPFSTHSNLQPSINVHRPSDILSQSLISQGLSILPINLPARSHRSSTISQRPHQASSLYNHLSSVFDQSTSVFNQSSSVSQPSSSIPQPSPSYHQQPSSVTQQSASIPQLPSNLLQQSSNPHVPMNTYYFF